MVVRYRATDDVNQIILVKKAISQRQNVEERGVRKALSYNKSDFER